MEIYFIFFLVIVVIILVVSMFRMKHGHRKEVARLRKMQRKKTRKLKECEETFELYQEALRAANTFVYKKNLETNEYFYFDPAFTKHLEVSERTVDSKFWKKYELYWEFRDEFESLPKDDFLKKFRNVEKEEWKADVRLTIPEKGFLWFTDQSNLSIDEDGNRVTTGTLRDITWRKKFELVISRQLQFEQIKQKLLINILQTREADFKKMVINHLCEIGEFCNFQKLCIHRVDQINNTLICCFPYSVPVPPEKEKEHQYICDTNEKFLLEIIQNNSKYPDVISRNEIPESFLKNYPENCQVLIYKLIYNNELFGLFTIIRTEGPVFDVAFKNMILQSHSRLLTILIRRQEELLQIEQAQKNLEGLQRYEAFSRMTAAIVHEFNNHLTGLFCNLELIEESVEDDEIKESIREMNKSLESSRQLLAQLEAYSGHDMNVKHVISVKKFIESNQKPLQEIVEDPHRLKIALSRDGFIKVNEPEFLQVLIALIRNAKESQPADGGVIYLSYIVDYFTLDEITSPYVFGNMDAGEYVQFTIQDRGSGIEPGIMDKIFDPFFTTKFIGRGVGLTFVLGVIRKYHGALTISSKPGEGTRIRIYLPHSDSIVEE